MLFFGMHLGHVESYNCQVMARATRILGVGLKVWGLGFRSRGLRCLEFPVF